MSTIADEIIRDHSILSRQVHDLQMENKALQAQIEALRAVKPDLRPGARQMVTKPVRIRCDNGTAYDAVGFEVYELRWALFAAGSVATQESIAAIAERLGAPLVDHRPAGTSSDPIVTLEPIVP